MKFANIDNWKTVMKRVACERSLSIQDVQQRYVLEEFAEKISHSKYKNTLVLKGGFVVSTLLGLTSRMTRDIDVTCRSTVYSLNDMVTILSEVINSPIETFFHYSLTSIKPAQENDSISGFVAKITAENQKTRIMLKVDISNNTFIYPDALHSSLPSLFSNGTIKLAVYSVENIIAEKFETTLDRGEINGRMKDIMDIYLLMTNNASLIDDHLLANTIIEIMKNRGTFGNLDDYDRIIQLLKKSDVFSENFLRYRNEQYPCSDISLVDVFNVFQHIKTIIDAYCTAADIE